MTLSNQTVSLAALARQIEPDLDPCSAYLPGKTILREAVMRRLECSALRAERLIDTMEAEGLIKHQSGDHGAATWHFNVSNR